MIPVVVSPRAGAELDALIEWLAARAPDAARRAAEAVFAAIRGLADFPEMAPKTNGWRDKTVKFGRDGFVVRYRVEADRLTILRVFHGRQDR